MIELQRKLIGDSVRNEAFAKAIKEVVVPNKSTVIDLGSGTGFLGFLASRAGAKHVTYIEGGEIIDISLKLAARNGIKNATFIARHSTDIKTTEIPYVDILISETLGNYALEENIIESVEDAKRFLKPDAVIIPGKIRQFVCPVVSDRIPKDVDVWDAGFDMTFDEARNIGQNNIYVKTLKKEDLLAENGSIRQWDDIDFSTKNASIRKGVETWKVDAKCTVHGFALWWDAELVPGVTLSTSPLEKPTHWEQIFLPLLDSIKLAKGESVSVSLHSDTRWKVKINLSWQVRHLDAAGGVISEQTLDMMKGYLN